MSYLSTPGLHEELAQLDASEPAALQGGPQEPTPPSQAGGRWGASEGHAVAALEF